MYYPEVSGAPGFKTFGSTAASFLKEKHSDFIRLTVANRKINTANEKINKKDIRQAVVKEFPYPEVEVIPISSEGSLREFLQQ